MKVTAVKLRDVTCPGTLRPPSAAKSNGNGIISVLLVSASSVKAFDFALSRLALAIATRFQYRYCLSACCYRPTRLLRAVRYWHRVCARARRCAVLT
eukprot:3537931-Rhodomonas_salina.2